MDSDELDEDFLSFSFSKESTSSIEESHVPGNFHEQLGIRIQPTSAEEIRRGSTGEVQTDRFFSADRKSFHPKGLFSEKIFGLTSDWKHSKITAQSPVGHIELPVPIVHPLFQSGLAGQAVRAVLGLTEAELDQLLKGRGCIVTEPMDSGWSCGAIVTVDAYQTAAKKYGAELAPLYQAEAVRWLMGRATLDASIARAKLVSPDNSGVVRLIRKWFERGRRLDSVILDVLPVIPPAMRAMQRTSSGELRRHDLTCLYQKVVRRCGRIRKLVKLDAPSVILRNEARLLHEAVENLLVKPSKADEYKSKSRRFMPLLQTLQESHTPLCEEGRTKTWKNSLRLPASPNPRLRITQCGLPRTAATLEMLAPIWLAHCKQIGLDPSLAEWQLRHPTASVWEVIALQLPWHAVLLRHEARRSQSSLQAFQPKLVDGRAIQLSPLALGALRDGSIQEDVSVFLLQSRSACSQALVEMLADQCRNSASGKLAYQPTLDMVTGCFLMTRDPLPISEGLSRRPLHLGAMAFRTMAEVQSALDQRVVSWNSPILFYPDRRTFAEQPLCEKVCAHRQRIGTTPGRVIFNDFFPLELPFVNYQVTENSFGDQLEATHAIIGATRTRQLIDALQATALAVLTQSGLSISISDLAPPRRKPAILDETNKQIVKLKRYYDRGIICSMERLNQTYDAWTNASKILNQEIAVQLSSESKNPTSLFAAVAHTTSMTWVQHLCGMFGIVLPPDRRIHEVAVTSNWGEGLSVREYWQVALQTRHFTIDECKRTEDAEQITRTLLSALQDVTITVADCGTTEGIERSSSADKSLSEALIDRISCEAIVNPINGEPLVQVGERITAEIVQGLASLNVQKLRVRSPATCDSERGICQQCYGRNQSTGELTEIGTSVGVNAAYALGEYAHHLLNWYKIREYRAPRFGWVNGTERADCSGNIQFQLPRTVRKQDGRIVALQPGKILIRDRYRILQEIAVPVGAEVLVRNEAEVRRDDEICKWNTNGIPLIAENAGSIILRDFVPGDNCRYSDDSDTNKFVTSDLTRGTLRPRVLILNAAGQPIEAHYLADHSVVEVVDGQSVAAGDMLALQLNRSSLLEDRASEAQTVFGWELQELLEAGPTHETAVLAPCDSVVSSVERKGEHRKVVLQNVDREEFEFVLSRNAHLQVIVGDAVKPGDPLTDSRQINPNDIFRILGVEAGILYLLGRLSRLFVKNQISIDSKHMELVIGRMLSRVKIDHPGDTDFVAGEVIERIDWRRENDRINQFVRIASSEASKSTVDQIVRREAYELLARELTSQNQAPPTVRRSRPARAAAQLTSIQHLVNPHKQGRRSGEFDVDVLARLVLAGDVSSINRLIDLIVRTSNGGTRCRP